MVLFFRSLGLAWRKTVTDLVGSCWRAFFGGTITILASLASFKILELLKRETPEEALLPLLAGPLTLTAVGFVGLLVNWASVIPYREWVAAESASKEAQAKLRPILKVLNSGVLKVRDVQYGTTQRSMGGTKETILRISPPFYCVDVENASEVPDDGCAAYIEGFKEVGEKQIDEWQTMPIPWLPVADDRIEKVGFSPRGRRTLFLFGMYKNRVSFVSDLLPSKIVHLIEDQGEYEGVIVLTSSKGGVTRMPFNLCCDAPDNEPILTVFAGQ